MDNTISSSTIESTNAYKKLGESIPGKPFLNNKMQQEFLLKRNSRKDITHALIVYNSTNEIPSTINGNQLVVLKELIANDYKIV
jgi:hypothetical protein